jgi:iron complex transport system ATP-binding protein
VAVLRLEGVGWRREGRPILDGVDWEVRRGEHWVVLGANGSGKTTLARIATMWEHPSTGSVEVLGRRLGQVDVRDLRTRVALVSSAMADMVRPALSAEDVVVCARHAALEPWWHRYSEADRLRARRLLADQGVGTMAGRAFGSLSSGERQRVLLARALMGRAGLVVLDEPSAGLDLGGREDLVDRLDALAASAESPPSVLVTHHVEEIPARFTHLLAMGAGRVLASGPIEATLTAEVLSECFGVPVTLDRHDAGGGPRWSARRS